MARPKKCRRPPRGLSVPACSVWEFGSNLALSEDYAKLCRDYLVKVGVPTDRFEIRYYGESRPACVENEESCWLRGRKDRFERFDPP